jgi:hypothetical protein
MTKARDTANLTGSGVGLSLLDIDAGTDIGAALVDADLMIVDDGAGGTNRKATMSRLATYMGTKIGGGMEFIASSGAISNAASSSFTQFDASKYDHYKFFFQYVTPATDNVTLLGHVSTDGGSNYDTTNGNYHVLASDYTGLRVAVRVGSDTNEFGHSGEFSLWAPHNSSVYTYSTTFGATMDQDASTYGIASAATFTNAATVHLAAQDVDAIQFKFSSGNIESGEITMFGIVNS